MFLLAFQSLVDQWLLEDYRPGRSFNMQISPRIQPKWFFASDLDRNQLWIGSRRDNEVVFDLSLGSPKHHIDSRIHLFVSELAVIRHSQVPSFRIFANH